MTLTCPPLEKTDRPVPSRLPEKGSKIIPSLSAVVPPSVVGTRMGVPAALRIGAPSIRLKSPLRKSAVGTEDSTEKPVRSNVPSQFPKKNSLFFLIGPPRLPPSMLRLPSGLSVTPARFSSQVNVRSALLSYIANAVAAQVVRAGLGDDGDGRAAGHALLGIEVVGGDVDFLDAFHRRDVHRVVRHRDQDVGRTVHARVVGAALLAVDVGRQGASRRIGDGVLKPRRCGAWDEIDERLVVAVAGQRQVLHRRRVEADADIRLRRLEDDAAGLDADLFGDRAQLDGGVDASDDC